MMLHPALIAVLALLYAVDYIYLALRHKAKRYLLLGKAFGRLVLASAYLYFVFVPIVADTRAPLVRWSLLIFLGIDLFFAVQEHVMNFIVARHDRQD